MRYTFTTFKNAVEQNGYTLVSDAFTAVADKFIFRCPRCSIEFERKGSKALLKERTCFCRKCSCEVHAETKVKPSLVTCVKCGGSKAKKRTSNFCNSCWKEEVKTNMSLYRKTIPNTKGDLNPSWKGGGDVYWKRQVVSVGKCDICSYSGTALNAHHLYARSMYPDMATDVDNGVCLCANCHGEFHHEYGNDVTAKDYIEFKDGKNGN